MINSNYAIQAEQVIYARDEDKREQEAIAWMIDVQKQFTQEYGYELPEHQALLLLIKQDKISMVQSKLKDVQREIEKIEDSLFILLTKKKELQKELFDAKKNFSNYDNKLRKVKEEQKRK